MTRDEYIRENIDQVLYKWGNNALLMGTVFILSFCFLDYFLAREHFTSFLLYRVIASNALILLYFLNRTKTDRRLQNLVGFSAAIVVSIMLAAMIYKYNGHRSLYFAGFIFCIVYVLGFLPLSYNVSLLSGIVMYLLYLVPILVYDTITDHTAFISSNTFILATLAAVLWFRKLSENRTITEMGLKYDLEKKKQEVEKYSERLEELVEERTIELQESEAWHRNIFENAVDAILILNNDGMIINANDQAAKLYDYNKNFIVNSHFCVIESKKSLKDINKLISNAIKGKEIFYEATHYNRSGTAIDIEINGKAIKIGDKDYVQLYIRDISQKKKMQDRILHSQKMEAIGTLTGGIAHDFNNSLTAILGYTELISAENPNLPQPVKTSLNIIEKAGRNSVNLVSKLLNFSRKSISEKLPINFNAVLQDNINMMSRLIGSKIKVSADMAEDLPLIEADPTHMEQVAMNLIINARDAMPGGGDLILLTKIIELDSDSLNIGTNVVPGRYVSFTVKDTGTGIPRDIIQRIFEPFFTTKKAGKGTGLGLATVYGIVKDNKGYMTVDSEEGQGTEFNVYFPVSDQEAISETSTGVMSMYGEEVILLIEDERDLLEYSKKILTQYGYSVIATDIPEHAIKTYREVYEDIDLVITDMVMPDIDGNKVIREIKKINPDAKIIAISGLGQHVLEKGLQVHSFLNKPYDANSLLINVKRVIDISAPTSLQ